MQGSVVFRRFLAVQVNFSNETTVDGHSVIWHKIFVTFSSVALTHVISVQRFIDLCNEKNPSYAQTRQFGEGGRK